MRGRAAEQALGPPYRGRRWMLGLGQLLFADGGIPVAGTLAWPRLFRAGFPLYLRMSAKRFLNLATLGAMTRLQ